MEGRRILVIDDEADIRDLLTEALTGAGFVVDAAPTAGEGLDLVREHLYEVAVIDFGLPDMDGVFLHRRLREMDEELADRTIFMSGLVQSGENLEYYADSSAGFLEKPFDLERLLELVRGLAGSPPAEEPEGDGAFGGSFGDDSAPF